MDKAQAKAIGADVRAALDEVWAKHGLQQSKQRATFYEDDRIRFTIEAISLDPDLDPKRTDWAQYAALYGLDEDWLDKPVSIGGRTYTITGFLPSRRKRPVHLTSTDGREVITTIESIQRAMGVTPSDEAIVEVVD